MCGINGFNFVDRELIQKMNNETKHRGPDDVGVFLSKNYSLGHNRLSIIDLSDLGHQPMHSKDGRYTIIYNGEIYNFQGIKKELIKKGYNFVSKTDTEVVLYSYIEWGKECLQKFNGMFSFAILDNKTDKIFLTRDRVGIKPLYYYHKGNKFIFSSEAKAILQHNIKTTLNKDALNIYFRLMYVPAPMTMWNEISKLEPGCFAILENNNFSITKYWDYKNTKLIKDKDYIKKEINRLLEESIKIRLMADRPVGIFLSGGIDSTIITGIASGLSKKIKTFSAGFEKTSESEKYNADRNIAKKTAKYFGTDHKEYLISIKDVKENLKKVVYRMDEPVSNPTQVATMILSEKASKEVAVVLGGDGGDELFGGYDRYYYSYIIDNFQKIPEVFRKNILIKKMAQIFGKEKLYNKLNSNAGVDRLSEFMFQKEDDIKKFLKSEYNDSEITYKIYKNLYFKNINKKDFTRQFMQTDIKSWIPNESLVRSDKMTMSTGLEERVPFLDHRIVEFADRIPMRYKINLSDILKGKKTSGRNGKMVLKEAMSEYIPGFVLNQDKRGWFSPAAKWIRGGLRPLVEEVLSKDYCEGTKDIFDFEAIQEILEKHCVGEKYALNTLWPIITFQLWYKEYMD